MKSLTLTVIVFLLISGSNVLFSQTDTREDFLDAEFFFSEEDYNEALFSFQKVYKAGYQDNANINYRIGVCYFHLPGQKEKAVPYLEKAISNISAKWAEGSFKEISAPPDAYLYLGNAYRISYKLDEAILNYNKYLSGLDRSMTAETEYTSQQIQSCERAKKVIQKPVPIYKENLGTKINSNTNNSQVVTSGDNNSMAYVNQLRFYDAIFYVKKINGRWTNSINITPQIESDGDLYVSSLSFDGLKLYMVKRSNFDADIFVSDYSMGRWMPAKSIGRPVNSKYFESHASISPDGKTLYFTSNRKESIGGMDIFVSSFNEKGNWSEPVNLGEIVNTRLNEETPFISMDGKTLYFSSQGHVSIGGFDIFKTVKQADGTWSKPEGIPYPINTTDDDLFFFPLEKENSGYITLYEPGGLGSGDLYYVEELSRTLATIENKRMEFTETIKSPVKEVETKTAVTKPTEKIVTPSPKYNIKPIYFDFNSFSLTENSKAKLREIFNIFTNYPELRLEVRGHTDALGSFEYNQTLSEKRAKAVIDFLVSEGASQDRLLLKGLSESENVAINKFPDGRDSAEGRKLNRRVEFKIAKEGGALLMIEPVDVPETLKVK